MTVISRVLAVAVLLLWPYRGASVGLLVPLFALWVLVTLGIFELRLTRRSLTRHLGPSRVSCNWEALTRAQVQTVPLFGPVRLVLADSQQQISFPLFLLSASARVELADRLALYLPGPLGVQWQRSGFDRVVRARR